MTLTYPKLAQFKPRLIFPALLPKKKLSLSSFFPEGTHYFYGYPAGNYSGFLNNVPPKIEELVAARAFSCAGSDVKVVAFAATSHPAVESGILEKFGIPNLPDNRISLIHSKIDRRLVGNDRNEAIKNYMKAKIPAGSLVMAQPYTDKEMAALYQIPSKTTNWLNDKIHMSQYITPELLPKQLALFKNGGEFAKQINKINLPCVVKVSSSSSGDGVYICKTLKDLSRAVDEFKKIKSTIVIQEHIEAVKNYGIHFGIPHDIKQSVEVYGVNEQLTTDQGEFVGGVIRSTHFPPGLRAIKLYLENEILPVIRKMGWYGIGGFDVLLDSNKKAYFIDCNFRMTGVSAYHMLLANGKIKAPLITFSAEFKGTKQKFKEVLSPYAAKDEEGKFVQIIALSRDDNEWHFNAALSFDKPSDLLQKVDKLLDTGISSPALSQLAERFI